MCYIFEIINSSVKKNKKTKASRRYKKRGILHQEYDSLMTRFMKRCSGLDSNGAGLGQFSFIFAIE